MRGDQLASQGRAIDAIEASPNGLTVVKMANREETGKRTINRNPDALPAGAFPLYTERVDWPNRWAFNDTFKFKTPPPFTSIEFMSFNFSGTSIAKTYIKPCPGIQSGIGLSTG